MIVYPNRGKGAGKVGNSVFYVNHGVQIEREYTPQVSNPNTDAQISQRSRFKLASQVSAIMEPILAIPRKGMQSPRNLFVKKNMHYFYGTNEGAMVTYENLQITNGDVYLPGTKIVRDTREGQLTLSVNGDVRSYVSRVVYNVFIKTPDSQLQLHESVVVEDAGTNHDYSVVIGDPEGDVVVLSYGMRDKDANATAKYSAYRVQTGSDIAELITSRKIKESDYKLTQTRGTTIYMGATQNTIPDVGESMLYITSVGMGNIRAVINGGNAIISDDASIPVAKGATVVLTAEPTSTAFLHGQFEGWYINGEQIVYSMTNPLTITMGADLDIVAKFGSYSGSGGLE